jgi:proline iminopeptidase
MVYCGGKKMISLPARKSAPTTRLFVDICGKNIGNDSSAPLFILPGGPGANSTHFASYRCLQDSMELVFFDPRGCGASDKGDPIHYSLDNYIDDIEAIRKSLGIAKISLLGKSYSGLCALGYAIRYPQTISKLILVATGPSHHFIATAKKKLARIGSPEQIRVSEKLWEGRFTSTDEVEYYFNLMMPLYSTKAASTKASNLAVQELPFAYEPLNRGFLTDLRTVNFVNELSDIACQTFVITGDSDWIFDEKYSKLMANKIPNAKLAIFKNAGHFIEMDAADEFHSAIRNFMLYL